MICIDIGELESLKMLHFMCTHLSDYQIKDYYEAKLVTDMICVIKLHDLCYFSNYGLDTIQVQWLIR